ncbi:uncharacterized protein NECHADRAFT_78074 [Fusarium vanettenii 77-13-4]|uniref:Aminoglycoside phosphotransferase domain-containing protein n=1 Tax=Fusarium vanettenii (strain ATCC MYA-4622 / CBS 123669 / FGSC 9596 / NRRL 45880 / 77-13-4) TaxID=660122 RepID=C7YN17_FUSV7|nr:uncharacterized protein NECHADRAFT_78074 [Fusarium vanettenii 77-13-4]EEU47542.1 hypothetical protein NECHADRAFT_78074 [Fusarium vanettenii 77-13-4]
MRDRIIDDQIRREREIFIRLLKEEKGEAICTLASSYHDGAPCHIFAVTHGSFNICFMIQFNDPLTTPADRWVVRIPFPGRVPWIDEKIDSEIATMMYIPPDEYSIGSLTMARYIAKNTTIPIPKIHAWSYEAQSPIGHAFIIMDHVQGTPLNALLFRREERWAGSPTHPSPDLARVHEQLADIYIQLRGLEFPEIGALGMPTSDSSGITIRHRPLPIEVALQEVEKLKPTEFFPEKKTFKTAREYIQALVKLGHNRLVRAEDPDMGSLEVASRVALAHNEFYKHMLTRWQWRTKSKPFVLMHGDLTLHGNNLLWDDKLNLVAVLDWEWCHAVPVSFFIPPAWLGGFYSNPIRELCCSSVGYFLEVKAFCMSIVARSKQSPLETEWQQLPQEPHCTLVLALLHPEAVDDVYWDSFIYRFYSPDGEKVAEERLMAFLKRPDVNDFLNRRVASQKRHDEKYQVYAGQVQFAFSVLGFLISTTCRPPYCFAPCEQSNPNALCVF